MDKYDKIIEELKCKDGVADITIKANTKIGKKLIKEFYYNNWVDSGMNNELWKSGSTIVARTCCFTSSTKQCMQNIDSFFKHRRIKKEISNLADDIFLSW